MSRSRQCFEVARWEVLRYVKARQQMLGLMVTFAMLLTGAYCQGIGSQASRVRVAVVGAERIGGLPEQVGRFHFATFDSSALPGLRRQVETRDLDAVLVLHSASGGTLHVRQVPGWSFGLTRELTTLAQRHRLRQSGLPPPTLARVEAPYRLALTETAPRAGRSEQVVALFALMLTLIGLFSGVSYIFSSVTGEKQNRLAEQVISTIPPQVWIDGKILGLAAVSVVAMLNALLAVLIFLFAARVVWGRALPLPGAVRSPGLLLIALLLVGLGFLFWFTFLTAVAAIVDDPHTSTRNQLIFLPALGLVPAALALRDPDALWVRVLSVLPPTSGTVMPVRLVVTAVGWKETALALGLLLAAIWLVRRLAGRVFRLGMLMYGKEPSWREVRRWIRQA